MSKKLQFDRNLNICYHLSIIPRVDGSNPIIIRNLLKSREHTKSENHWKMTMPPVRIEGKGMMMGTLRNVCRKINNPFRYTFPDKRTARKILCML